MGLRRPSAAPLVAGGCGICRRYDVRLLRGSLEGERGSLGLVAGSRHGSSPALSAPSSASSWPPRLRPQPTSPSREVPEPRVAPSVACPLDCTRIRMLATSSVRPASLFCRPCGARQAGAASLLRATRPCARRARSSHQVRARKLAQGALPCSQVVRFSPPGPPGAQGQGCSVHSRAQDAGVAVRAQQFQTSGGSYKSERCTDAPPPGNRRPPLVPPCQPAAPAAPLRRPRPAG
jgi:hypothetical protein